MAMWGKRAGFGRSTDGWRYNLDSFRQRIDQTTKRRTLATKLSSKFRNFFNKITNKNPEISGLYFCLKFSSETLKDFWIKFICSASDLLLETHVRSPPDKQKFKTLDYGNDTPARVGSEDRSYPPGPRSGFKLKLHLQICNMLLKTNNQNPNMQKINENPETLSQN